VVVLSEAFTRAEVEDRLKQYKIVDFMEKPFTAKDLLEKVESAARVADSMSALAVSADRLKAATESLKVVAGLSITEISRAY
jgi:FixJ family two-component response regulator